MPSYRLEVVKMRVRKGIYLPSDADYLLDKVDRLQKLLAKVKAEPKKTAKAADRDKLKEAVK